jgi:hypothetical protein
MTGESAVMKPAPSTRPRLVNPANALTLLRIVLVPVSLRSWWRPR